MLQVGSVDALAVAVETEAPPQTRNPKKKTSRKERMLPLMPELPEESLTAIDCNLGRIGNGADRCGDAPTPERGWRLR